MEALKVLIITYYWPPSGGAGVQRWVKLTKYLHRHGVEAHVLTVREDHASYMQLDPGLAADIAPEVTVYRTKSFEPIRVYSRLVGKEKVPTAGFANVDDSRPALRIANLIRSHLFIPDPRRGWNRFAYRRAKEIIRREGIRHVITTSPPHSTQLIGMRLQRRLGLRWIADMRDPWTDIYYYPRLGHSRLSAALDRRLERQVLRRADAVISVGRTLTRLFLGKDERIDPNKFHYIPNGFDAADFSGRRKQPGGTFTVCYTGTMSDLYDPMPFFTALKEALRSFEDLKPRIQIVGTVSPAIAGRLEATGLDFTLVPTVPHSEVLDYQVGADLLLLIIPGVAHAETILTGKLFEYLASGNPILCLGPPEGDAADIIRHCDAGATFGKDDATGIATFLRERLTAFTEGKAAQPDREAIGRFSREEQARTVSKILKMQGSA